MKTTRIALAILAAGAVTPAFALNILLTNDDGFAAPNIRALYIKLKAAGHDVIVSAPCQNQSGKGASLNFLTPLTALTKDCRGGTVKVGAPGVGTDPTYADISYVDGTPVMATMYGLDVLAPARWGKQPDVVISGPNEGQNLGGIVNTSGTVSNAIFAANRGLPAIAISADTNTTDNAALADEVAVLSIKFLAALQAKAGSGPLLPTGTSLNVNFPTFTAGGSANLPWVFSRFGTFSTTSPKFVADLSKDPVASGYGVKAPYPGVTFVIGGKPDSTQADNEAALNAGGKITVTAMQVGFEARPQSQQWLRLRLRDLLAK
ncbi:5'-nucleotidase SurE [Andreprevotia sp. IGB-42]|uniref:5'/3'-nucleotidase SurE n=1 Tax=Andreprevotia sp. IGB-42 TaxID=2497473 RepID=UPI001357B0F5|nr:5'/3'-nucleotidase SurE [Andreprevotia sp. IGB-42]KAF0811811.1 5'-nucleotidase SurE [Andreprevotia sp. IGB-42]